MRAVLLALAVCAARADDYAAPQYGGAAVDYERGAADDYRSSPAPAHLDYNYDEQQRESEKPPKYVNEVERWQKSRRTKRRRPAKEDLEYHEPDADSVRESKTRRVRLKHSPRREEPRRRHALEVAAALGRARRGKHDDESDQYLDNYHDDRSKYLEDDDFTKLRETTARIVRRKPRDRMFAPLPSPTLKSSHKGREFLDDDVDDNSIRPLKGDDKPGEPEYWGGARPTLSVPDPRVERYTDGSVQGSDSHKLGAYQDYSDYYNMKKLENLKTKIPVLLRRTTTTELAPVRSTPGLRIAGTAVPSAAPARTTTNTAASVAPANSTDADRLRLAIKNRMKTKTPTSKVTRKPPVLLLVTRRPATVVVVEPARGDRRLAAGDAPGTLARVKQVMRSRLVARAGTAADLTDHWNDTVCEYIDMAMLRDSAAATLASARFASALLYCTGGLVHFWVTSRFD